MAVLRVRFRRLLLFALPPAFCFLWGCAGIIASVYAGVRQASTLSPLPTAITASEGDSQQGVASAAEEGLPVLRSSGGASARKESHVTRQQATPEATSVAATSLSTSASSREAVTQFGAGTGKASEHSYEPNNVASLAFSRTFRGWDLFQAFYPSNRHRSPHNAAAAAPPRPPRRRKRAKRLVLSEAEEREIRAVDARILGRARDLIRPRTGHTESDQPGKIAFLFLTKGPMPLERLWERFFQGHEGEYAIHIHSSDVNGTETGPPPAFWGFRGCNVPGVRIAWGSLTMVTATRRLLAAALADTAVQRFVLLSETCIPVRNFSAVCDYLFSSHCSYIDSGRTGWRYNKKLAPVVNRWQWHKGSQWFVLIRHHAELLVEDDLYFNQFRKAKFFIADEHYVQIVLELLDPGRLIRRTLTFKQMQIDLWHPVTYAEGNTTAALIRRIQHVVQPVVAEIQQEALASRNLHSGPVEPCRNEAGAEQPCFLFARKFDPSALGRLLKMPELLGY